MPEKPSEVDDEDDPPAPPTDPLVPRAALSWLVGNLPVWTSDADVREALLPRMTDPTWTDELKEQAIAYALHVHHQAQALCRHFRL